MLVMFTYILFDKIPVLMNFEAVSGQLEIFSFFCGRLPKSTWESIVYLSLTSFIAFKFQYSDLYIWIWISCFQHGHDIVLRFYFKKKRKRRLNYEQEKKINTDLTLRYKIFFGNPVTNLAELIYHTSGGNRFVRIPLCMCSTCREPHIKNTFLVLGCLAVCLKSLFCAYFISHKSDLSSTGTAYKVPFM